MFYVSKVSSFLVILFPQFKENLICAWPRELR